MYTGMGGRYLPRAPWQDSGPEGRNLVIHIHQVVRAKMDGRDGLVTLESLIIGRHEPSGFNDLFDGAVP